MSFRVRRLHRPWSHGPARQDRSEEIEAQGAGADKGICPHDAWRARHNDRAGRAAGEQLDRLRATDIRGVCPDGILPVLHLLHGARSVRLRDAERRWVHKAGILQGDGSVRVFRIGPRRRDTSGVHGCRGLRQRSRRHQPAVACVGQNERVGPLQAIRGHVQQSKRSAGRMGMARRIQHDKGVPFPVQGLSGHGQVSPEETRLQAGHPGYAGGVPRVREDNTR